MQWVSAVDTYLSGWGESEGRTNIFLLECATPDEVMHVVALLQKRAEMKNITIHESETRRYSDTSKFKVDLRNRESAPAWYPAEPTKEEKYVAEGGLHCPQCGSEDINGGSLEVDCVKVTQECTCTACGAFWEDHYTLTGFSVIEEGRGRREAEEDLMLRLKGQTGSGEWVVFSVSDIEDANRDYTEIRLLNGDNINYILTSTIQPADDPRKQMLEEIREQIEGFRYWTNYEGAVDFLISRTQVEMILDEMEAKL